MDYLQQAFGVLNFQADKDAAVKFALISILMNDRLLDLSSLLIDGHGIGAVEGEPGWIIERRDTGLVGDSQYYAEWPINARFHAHVAPAVFELAYPDSFMTESDFHKYVARAMNVYLGGSPADVNVAQFIVSQL